MAIEKTSKISVIIPVAPESNYKKTLSALKRIKYPKKNLEIFLIFGNNPSKQRNEGIKRAKGKIILFLDNDSIIKGDYFLKMIDWHKQYDIVGGPALTDQSNSSLQKAFGYVIGSYLATQKMRAKFNSIGKPRVATEKELILCNLSIKKDFINKYGGFNEKLYPNEENELLNRLASKGAKLYYDPNLIIYRDQRKNIFKFIKQFFRYGKSRIEHFKLAPKNITPLFFAPSLFILYIISLFFYASLWYLLPLLFYFILNLITSISILIKSKDWKHLFIVPLLFPILHLSYGFGVFWGIFHKKKPLKNKIKIKKIKF